MRKLSLALIYVVAVMLLLTAASCGKKSTEPEVDFPNFQDLDQFEAYCNSFVWNFSLGYEIVGKDMEVWFDFESESDISPNDTYSLMVNNQNVPVEVRDGVEPIVIINDYDEIVLPNSTSLAIKFTRNNEDIINTSVKLPSYPSLQDLPETIDWTEPVTVKWSLAPNKNNHAQAILAYGENELNDYHLDSHEVMIDVSARRYAIPANTFSLDDTDYYGVDVWEINLKKHGDGLVIAYCSDYISNEDEVYSLNNKRIFDKMRKTRYQQED
jgi:hypothetical protein